MKTLVKVGLMSVVLLAAVPFLTGRENAPSLPTAHAHPPNSEPERGVQKTAGAALLRATQVKNADPLEKSGPALPACSPSDAPETADCIPLDPHTGQPFTVGQMARFSQIRLDCRAKGLCGAHNRALPSVLSPEEAARRKRLRERVEELAQKLTQREASPDELDEYFTHVNQANHHKKQVLTYLCLEEEGALDELEHEHDEIPLDLENMSPALREAHEEIERAEAIIYLQHRIQMRNAGFAVDGENPESADAAQAYETARVRLLTEGS
ncbi:MAG: hypothetical protein IPK82_42190 [Polyangiaceae bacterium]|nr:hypothetical protein [Polyangiaceae bacterium]